MSSYEVREVRDSDIDALLDCALVTFGPQHAKSRAEWEWAFQRPGIERHGIIAVQGESVLAAYLGIAQHMWIGGEERLCVQPADLMVHPDMRRGLQKRGPYLDVAEAFIERYGTRGSDVFHYGWPVDAARRSGQRLMGYEFVREELCLVRDLAQAPSAMPSEVTPVTDFGDDLRWLWDRCAPDWGAATIRDAAWVRWRFLERPACEYRLFGVRDHDCLRGLAVLRRTPWDWPGSLPLCGWLVPEGEPETAQLLDDALRFQAREWGSTNLVTLFPDSSATFGSFQERGWRVRSSPYKLVARSYDRRFDVDWLRTHWWYDLSDSDLA